MPKNEEKVLKTVFIPSYYFPPYARVSIVRSQKFCKYLPMYGWKPWVLTVDERYYGHKVVNNGLGDIQKTRVTKIPYYRFPGNVVAIKIIFPLIALALAVRHKKSLAALYMSGSPFYPFLLTLPLTGLMHLPSILDFRDLWSINHGYDGKKAKGLMAKIREYVYGAVENISIRYASAVVFSTPVLQDQYTDLIPKYRHKYRTILNGYDPDDFLNIEPLRLSSDKTIIAAGQINVYTPEVVYGLIKSLKELPELHFVYIGEENEVINSVVNLYNVESQVTSLPYQPYSKTLQYIAGADYALVTTGMANGLGTKIFDYLALDKIVLCFVPKESMIKQIFGNYQQLLIIEGPHSEHSIRQALKQLPKLESMGECNLTNFTRNKATQQLAEILRSITDHGTG